MFRQYFYKLSFSSEKEKQNKEGVFKNVFDFFFFKFISLCFDYFFFKYENTFFIIFNSDDGREDNL